MSGSPPSKCVAASAIPPCWRKWRVPRLQIPRFLTLDITPHLMPRARQCSRWQLVRAVTWPMRPTWCSASSTPRSWTRSRSERSGTATRVDGLWAVNHGQHCPDEPGNGALSRLNLTYTRRTVRQPDSAHVDRSVIPVEYVDQGPWPGALNMPYDGVDELAPQLLPDKMATIVVHYGPCANLQHPPVLKARLWHA